tara:strand:+ start:513 stop:695 length:183 start_codon:yes stop_codon:yes gene_type:complete
MAEKNINSTLSRLYDKARGIVGEGYSDTQAMSRVFNLARGMVSPTKVVKKAKGGKVTKRK